MRLLLSQLNRSSRLLPLRPFAVALLALLFCLAGNTTETEPEEGIRELPSPPSADHSSLFRQLLELPEKLFNQKKEKDLPELTGSITVLGKTIAPATSARLSWKPQDTFESIAVPTPVLVMNGAAPGPTLCLTGAVHGDEINGIEIIRQVFFSLKPEELSGVVIGVPIVNQLGFRRSSRYLPDRRDLNRYFPGDPKGSSASRIAYSFFNDIIRYCDSLIDLHTGSFHRTNVPQLRADMTNDQVSQLVHSFGGIIVLHHPGGRGTLRRAAVEIGIPSSTLEAGEPMRIQEDVVKDGAERILTLMANMGMYKNSFFWSDAEPVYLNSRWVRSEQGGLLISNVKVGDKIKHGDLLGKVVDPIENREYPIHSPYEGQVIGMALNQVVMPGYAAYHLGIKATEDSIETVPDSARSSDGAPLPSDQPQDRRADLPEFDE